MLELTLPPQHGLLGIQVWQYYEEGQTDWWVFWADPVDNGTTCPGTPLTPTFTFPAWRGHHAAVAAELIVYAKQRELI